MVILLLSLLIFLVSLQQYVCDGFITLPKVRRITSNIDKFKLEVRRIRNNFLPSNNNNRNHDSINRLITVTNSIILVNCFIFMLQKVIPNFTGLFIKNDYLVSRGHSHRLLTSLFLHGSVPHLVMNMFSVYNIGPQAERTFGKSRFAAAYIFSGLLGNSLTYLFHTSKLALGASGCIYGIVGSFFVFFYRNKHILGTTAQSGLDSIKRTLLINVFYGMSSSNIDHYGHAFGFISGAIYSYLFGPRLIILNNTFNLRRVVDRPLLKINVEKIIGVDKTKVTNFDDTPDIFDQINSRNRNKRIY